MGWSHFLTNSNKFKLCYRIFPWCLNISECRLKVIPSDSLQQPFSNHIVSWSGFEVQYEWLAHFLQNPGVYDGLKDCSCEFDPTNHALVAVGFTPDTFIIKNSWGPSWGDKGYITISRGLNTCRVSDYVYYPVIRNSDEPTNEPPTFVPTPDPSKVPITCFRHNFNCVEVKRKSNDFSSFFAHD